MDNSRRYLRLLITPLACALILWPAAAAPSTTHAVEPQSASSSAPVTTAGSAPEEQVTVDGSDRGRRYDGVGGITGHGATRLLRDYPRKERSELLDYLFKPGFGASMQLLKVEINGDINATTGTTPSHMRTPDDVNCQRGNTWWLMKQARKRNPDLKIAALQWGAPGWFDGGFWSQDNIDYILEWVGCARQHGIEIDYLGGWNESSFEPSWFPMLDRALEQRYPGIEIIAGDRASAEDGPPTLTEIEAMKADPAVKKAIDIVGWHSPCGVRDDRLDCPTPAEAREFGKPLWTSETSAQAHDAGAAPIARSLNRGYIDGRVTAHMFWPALWSGYGSHSLADTGMALASWPWSGHYEIGQSIWATAHTTQFTEPGWHYLNTGSRRLESGATVVSLASPDRSDYSMVLETLDVTEPTTVRIQLRDLPQNQLHLWQTNLSSRRSGDDFQYAGKLQPDQGTVEVRLEPGHQYTLSTIDDAGRGTAQSDASAAEQLPISFSERFDSYSNEELARYFADVTGSFQTGQCSGQRRGTCYQQRVTAAPIEWHGPDFAPTTLAGDPRWWGDYRVSADALLKGDTDYVELLARADGVQKDERVSGYHLRLSRDGSWRLYSDTIRGPETDLATGTLPDFDPTTWHKLGLKLTGNQLTVLIDGRRVGTVDNANHHRVGQIGLGTSKWHPAEFDNVQVRPTGRTPRFIPHAAMTATATSAQPGTPHGFEYPARAVVDDRPESYWRSRWEPSTDLPQSVTLDLGKQRPVHAITYQPDIERPFYLADPGNPITRYRVSVSNDGTDFRSVSEGVWANTLAATKVANLDKAHHARYVRLTARKSASNDEPTTVTVAELNVSKTPIPQSPRQ